MHILSSMIITILWFLIIAAVVYWIFTLIPLPQPGKNIALAVIILLLLIYFLQGGTVGPELFNR